MTKRITDARIERTADANELVEMFLNLTNKMRDLRLYSRDQVATCESAVYSTLSLKAHTLLEKLSEINPPVPEGDCDWQHVNVGDFLC